MGQMDAAAAVLPLSMKNIFSNIIRASSFFHPAGLNAWNNSISISAAIRSSIPSSGRSAKPEIGRRRSVSSLKAMTAWRTAMPACCGVSAPVNEHPNIRPTAAVFPGEPGIEFQNPWKRIGTCISVRNAAPCAQYMRYGVPCVRMPVPEHPASQHTGHGHMFAVFRVRI